MFAAWLSQHRNSVGIKDLFMVHTTSLIKSIQELRRRLWISSMEKIWENIFPQKVRSRSALYLLICFSMKSAHLRHHFFPRGRARSKKEQSVNKKPSDITKGLTARRTICAVIATNDSCCTNHLTSCCFYRVDQVDFDKYSDSFPLFEI